MTEKKLLLSAQRQRLGDKAGVAEDLISPARKPEQVALIGGTNGTVLSHPTPGSQAKGGSVGLGANGLSPGLLASAPTQLRAQLTKVRQQKMQRKAGCWKKGKVCDDSRDSLKSASIQQAQRLTPVIPQLRQENHGNLRRGLHNELETGLGYVARHCLKESKRKEGMGVGHGSVSVGKGKLNHASSIPRSL